MSLSGRIASLPVAAEPDRGAEAAQPFDGPLRALVHGACGSSPFLFDLVRREGAWLAAIADAEPEAALDALLTPLGEEDGSNADDALRLRKRRLALLVALADLGGIWPLETVTGALTRFADFAVGAAHDRALAETVSRGRLPADAPGMILLAMGKMGAFELNYSSDIDLICLFDETRFAPAEYAAMRSEYVRVTQRMVRCLSGQTAAGYVFRTDLRLRPDPSVTPVCLGAGVAETYYEAQGRTWERAAMIKARACAGDLAGGAAFLAAIAPFVWRRNLDFAAIEDAHDMQRRIREHRGLGGLLAIPGHDVKLGRGGIRAIEFFAQTRQLISGGRDASLRERGTVTALGGLAARGWVHPDVAVALAEAYREHRALEHRIQMVEDAQTHAIPKTAEGRARVAGLGGKTDLAAWESRLADRFERVHALTEPFFLPGGRGEPAGEGITGAFAAGLGYVRAGHATELVRRWQAGAIPATRSERARTILRRIAPEILRRLARAANPDEAITRFDGFLSGLPAGVQLLSLFEANPELLDLLAEIFAASPRLAGELAARPGVLDAVLDRDFFAPMPDVPALNALAATALAGAPDFERRLDAARRWVHERVFRVGVQLLRGVASPTEAGRGFSAVAEACLGALLPHVAASVAERYGPVPGSSVAVLAMGKLGSREMTISSDLDLIIIYDAGGATESAGRKPLPVTTWFSRLTQGLVAALTVPTAEGRLYDVDMRLRPSGRKGPVAVSLAAFVNYQRAEAWTWEHLALTRARVVAGGAPLAGAIEATIAGVRALPRDGARVLTDAREMRARIARAAGTGDDGLWEVKQRPGGILDIELVLQAGMLVTGLTGPRAPVEAIAPLERAGFLSAAQAATLAAALGLQLAVQQLARLAIAGRFSPEAAGAGLVQALCRTCGAPDLDTLAARLDRLSGAAESIVATLLGR